MLTLLYCQLNIGRRIFTIKTFTPNVLPHVWTSRDSFSDITHPGGCSNVPTCKPVLVASCIQFVRQSMVVITRKAQCLSEPTASTGVIQYV
jgi:hypothetical protein